MATGLKELKLESATLAGRLVRLEPLAEEHLPDLLVAAQDDDIWQYLSLARPENLTELRRWFEAAMENKHRGDELPFAIVVQASGRAIGSTRYMDWSAAHRHVEIGWTWLNPQYWRTPTNSECKYLLLRYAFEELGCIRVQLKTDLRNMRSQRAIERLGAVREGVLRKAVIQRDYQRSSVYYSILDDEWPEVKARLERMLEVQLERANDGAARGDYNSG